MVRPKVINNGKVYSIFLDMEIADKVRGLAKLTGVTFGEIVRQAIDNELKRRALAAAKQEIIN